MDIESRIAALEARNRRVEADKAWETSLARRASIAVVTYLVACSFLAVISTPNWALGALMPVIGYLLSTITIGALKQRWVAKYSSGS